MRVARFNLSDPTDPETYVTRGIVGGMPLNWRDDVTGQMETAVLAYLEQDLTQEQLRLVIAYIQHHIHAPCFLEGSPFGKVDGEMADYIRRLRKRSLQLKTVKDVNVYIDIAQGVGLDPL